MSADSYHNLSMSDAEQADRELKKLRQERNEWKLLYDRAVEDQSRLVIVEGDYAILAAAALRIIAGSERHVGNGAGCHCLICQDVVPALRAALDPQTPQTAAEPTPRLTSRTTGCAATTPAVDADSMPEPGPVTGWR